MKYRIKIEELIEPVEPDKYQKTNEIYNQTVENLDVTLVIQAVNGLVKEASQ